MDVFERYNLYFPTTFLNFEFLLWHKYSTKSLHVSQIGRHYSLNSITPELNIEKLQLIVTAKASSATKVKWLEYFNSSASTREARKLPPKPTTEEKLSVFLAKACFWAGVSLLLYLCMFG